MLLIKLLWKMKYIVSAVCFIELARNSIEAYSSSSLYIQSFQLQYIQFHFIHLSSTNMNSIQLNKIRSESEPKIPETQPPNSNIWHNKTAKNQRGVMEKQACKVKVFLIGYAMWFLGTRGNIQLILAPSCAYTSYQLNQPTSFWVICIPCGFF